MAPYEGVKDEKNSLAFENLAYIEEDEENA